MIWIREIQDPTAQTWYDLCYLKPIDLQIAKQPKLHKLPDPKGEGPEWEKRTKALSSSGPVSHHE
jgi:hypothetical protein